MADEFNVRDHILAIRQELIKVKPSVETSLAWELLDTLQQALWQVGIQTRGAEGVVVTPDIMRERAMKALAELGNNPKGAKALIEHLVSRGVIDLETWRPRL